MDHGQPRHEETATPAIGDGRDLTPPHDLTALKLSSKSRYGVRAVFDIAFYNGGQATQIKDIAGRQAIPPRFLEQIFQDLKRAGIVNSKRGPRGGYRLARPVEDISMGDIVRALEGPTVLVAPMPTRGARGDGASRTVTDGAFRELGQAIDTCFDGITVATLCERAEAMGARDAGPRRYVYVI